eukprot:3169533-Amphidinium_carterae.3
MSLLTKRLERLNLRTSPGLQCDNHYDLIHSSARALEEKMPHVSTIVMSKKMSRLGWNAKSGRCPILAWDKSCTVLKSRGQPRLTGRWCHREKNGGVRSRYVVRQ